jgi:hypothetical protein
MKIEMTGTNWGSEDCDDDDPVIIFKAETDHDDEESWLRVPAEQAAQWNTLKGKAVLITVQVLDIEGTRLPPDEEE